jgi:dTDP-4-amino-4,6-dideoxygalactose transaminase
MDLGRIHRPLRDRFLEALGCAVDTSRFALGEPVQRFEEAFAEYSGARHCIGVASGTDALAIALRAADVGPGDEVITVPNTFIATAAAVRLVGARPVFIDPDESTQLVDGRDVARLEAAVTELTKAIIPVHLFGQPVDMEPVLEFARERNLVVIEDAAQAHGARCRGRRVGALGSLCTCFSFYPGKNLGSLGEGGAVTAEDDAFAARVRRIRDHGSDRKYHHREIGWNSRIHSIQAAFLSIKLEHLDGWNEERRRLAARYTERLSGVAGVTPPTVADWAEPVFHLYVVRLANRDGAQEFLKARGIATAIHYPVPVHLQGAFADLGLGEGSFPVAERLAGEILSLPMFPGLTDEEVDRVSDALAEWSAAGKRNG